MSSGPFDQVVEVDVPMARLEGLTMSESYTLVIYGHDNDGDLPTPNATLRSKEIVVIFGG